MTTLPLERDVGSVVLIGSLNPTIFQPEWFVRHGLLRSFGEEKDDVLEIVSPSVTAFATEAFRLLVDQSRFSITCNGTDGLEMIRDLVLGAFRRLEHTPVTAMGMNREMHFAAPTPAAWHAFGDLLAPKGPWKGVMDGPGMLTVQMEGKRIGGTGGKLTVTVQPSRAISSGVCVQVNDHYDRSSNSVTETMGLLEEEFPRSMSGSLEIGQKLTGSVK